jgi:hypothetical protein
MLLLLSVSVNEQRQGIRDAQSARSRNIFPPQEFRGSQYEMNIIVGV